MAERVYLVGTPESSLLSSECWKCSDLKPFMDQYQCPGCFIFLRNRQFGWRWPRTLKMALESGGHNA